MTTLRERPVTSSSFSCMVTPSTMSPNFTMPADLGEDRRGERVPLGEELARLRPCRPRRTLSSAPYDEAVVLALAAGVVDDRRARRGGS